MGGAYERLVGGKLRHSGLPGFQQRHFLPPKCQCHEAKENALHAVSTCCLSDPLLTLFRSCHITHNADVNDGNH